MFQQGVKKWVSLDQAGDHEVDVTGAANKQPVQLLPALISFRPSDMMASIMPFNHGTFDITR